MAEPFDSFAHVDKWALTAAVVSDLEADALLQVDPQRYQAVTFRLPFTRFPQRVVVDASLLPAR